jgi:hypothetical protein
MKRLDYQWRRSVLVRVSYIEESARVRRDWSADVDIWIVMFWIGCVVGGALGLLALHRLALHLEERGHLYYVNKKPKSSAIGSFVALQRALEPQVQHVIQVKDERHLQGEKGDSGQGDPDDSVTPGIEPPETLGTT